MEHIKCTCFVEQRILLSQFQEFAGLGGDVGFFKNEIEAQANLPIWTTTDPATGETFSDVVLQVGNQNYFNIDHFLLCKNDTKKLN